MQSQEIEITIGRDGHVAYTIKGVKGSACDDISALLEQIGRVEAEERTGEYYEREEGGDVTLSIG